MSSTTDPTQEDIIYPFNYVPSFAAGVTFVVLFSVVTSLHLVQALRSRMWWLLPTIVTGGVSEVIGWSGRLWGSKNPTSIDPFLMQITTTIVGPTFILAANFVIVGRIILILGPQYSRLRPRLYTIVFCTCDVIALVAQAVGGAKASESLPLDLAGLEKGGHIVLGGIAFQFAAIVVYMLLSLEFLIRHYLSRPFPNRRIEFTGKLFRIDFKMKQLIFGMCFSSLCMFARSIYRTIELTDGWGGSVISNERLFIGLDGSLILLAMVVLSIFHPGRLMIQESSLMALHSQSVIEMWTKGS